MTDDVRRLDHDEVDLLLPWHVNDTLGAAESDGVAAHVATCTECQENVALLCEVQAAVVRNKAIPIVPQPRVSDLLDSISSDRSLHRRDRNLLKFYAVAATVALMFAATLLLTNRDDTTGVPNTFETATSSQSIASMDYVLNIHFEPLTSREDRQRVLRNIEARNISMGSEDGAYRVIVQLSAVSLEEMDQYTSELASLSEVRSVSVVALQLPVRPQ
jgi:hypothetical protein